MGPQLVYGRSAQLFFLQMQLIMLAASLWGKPSTTSDAHLRAEKAQPKAAGSNHYTKQTVANTLKHFSLFVWQEPRRQPNNYVRIARTGLGLPFAISEHCLKVRRCLSISFKRRVGDLEISPTALIWTYLICGHQRSCPYSCAERARAVASLRSMPAESA